MKILGLSCGRKMGNSELLLREALLEAEKKGAETEILRIHDLDIKPCTGCETCMKKRFEGTYRYRYECVIRNDDMPFLLDRLWEVDGQIVAAPIYSYNAPGYLRLILDRLHSSGKRGLKAVPGAVICVGGSDWINLCLPMTSDWITRIGGKLVNQMMVPFTASPAQVLLNEEAMVRARRIGCSMAEAVKLPIEEVQYIGDAMNVTQSEIRFYARSMNLPLGFIKSVIDQEGTETCPMCHTNLLQVKGGFVQCPMCDMKGTLEMEDGKIVIHYEDREIQNRRRTPTEFKRHMKIIQTSHRLYAENQQEIRKTIKKYKAKPVIVSPR